eukprot:TRINITY_DN3336_c0_g1_i4.p1 TRINITY_DN3336_c0_g1~~TRINITY_DN3336_c0_g1_i4.p1  ORF type:complete len:478 (+),score=123.71 TRINITY_DN3336_c0_g1_i4:103-1434(+)
MRRFVKGLPQVPNRFPTLTGLRGTKVLDYTLNILKDYPETHMIDLGSDLQGIPIVGLMSREAVKDFVLQQNRMVKSIRPEVTVAIGDGLVQRTGEPWRISRKILTPVFSYSILKEAVPVMISCAKRFVNNLDGKLAARDAYTQVTLDVIIQTSFGGKVDGSWIINGFRSLTGDLPKYALGKMLFGGIMDFLPIGRRIQKNSGTLNRSGNDYIESERKKGDYTANELVSLLFKMQEDYGEISNTYILDEVKTFLAAGHETTASTLGWTSYLLAENTSVQQKLFEEVDNVLQGREITPDDVGKLKYTKAVIEETLRIRPIIPTLTPRETVEEVTICGRTFPKGVKLLVYILAVHLNEKYWENPLEFRPERFLNLDSGKESYTWIPFGAGARSCIGAKFAIQEAIIILASVVQKYRISIQEGAKPIMNVWLTTTADNLELQFTPRK